MMAVDYTVAMHNCPTVPYDDRYEPGVAPEQAAAFLGLGFEVVNTGYGELEVSLSAEMIGRRTHGEENPRLLA